MGIQIRYGMVGGHMNAFIGEVHRKAIAFDPRAQLVAGCFSTNAEKNRETGETYSLDMSRVYPSYEAMAEAESRRPDGIDFVSITTPNNTHYDVAKCFLQHGIHVVCEKPLCFTVEQAQELVALAKEKNLVFGVTYTYSGYTMMKVAREMIAEGKIGKIAAVNAEYTPKGKPTEILSRGTGYITEKAGAYSRIPSGHPEGLIVAFANIYKNIISAILAVKAGGTANDGSFDYPTVTDGLNGVKFIHAVIDSAAKDSAWVEL